MKLLWVTIFLWTFGVVAQESCNTDLGAPWSLTDAVIAGNMMTPNNAYAVQAYVLARFINYPLPVKTLLDEPSEDDQRKLMRAAIKLHSLYHVHARELNASMPTQQAMARAKRTITDTQTNVRHVLNQIAVAETFGRITASDHLEVTLFDEFFAHRTRSPTAVAALGHALLNTFLSGNFKARAQAYRGKMVDVSKSTDPAVRESRSTQVHGFERDLHRLFLNALLQTGNPKARMYLSLLPH